MKILVVNPGGMSTKIAVYEGRQQLFSKTIEHTVEELSKFNTIVDQKEYRKDTVLNVLRENNIKIEDLDEFVGRGGMVRNLKGGVYIVNDKYISDATLGINGQHASNLGAIIANELAHVKNSNKCAFTVDPVVVDEYSEVARISGMSDITRVRSFHALNHKAVAIRYANSCGRKISELNIIVAHLGSGISVGAHKKGRIVDVNSALGGDGPMSPERCGGIPPLALIEMCYSGEFTYQEMYKKIIGEGGVFSYLGTKDMLEVEQRISEGDKYAALIMDALGYQVAKEIGACAAVLEGNVNSIILTGSISRSKLITDIIIRHVSFITHHIVIYPGEGEMDALAFGVYDAVVGNRPILTY
ncbi:butyrate kinase [Klebsiella aerogenes]|uniref:butyrate kinase n=1 Tax=Klebsiella aerogenes TaxID=548 RepID=UPI0021D09E42|nr:butyrate kinase [Klebsiella aerogenes]MCU6317008.1 butyrate kinase [Klebsiella aerogenes]